MEVRVRAMYRSAIAATTMLAFVGLGAWPVRQAAAQDAAPGQISSDGAAIKRALAHPPARIRVHPLAQSYPGPDAVRQCAAWLAPEYRLSGTVIVPKMHCWWERG
jgi:hypothetical protein